MRVAQRVRFGTTRSYADLLGQMALVSFASGEVMYIVLSDTFQGDVGIQSRETEVCTPLSLLMATRLPFAPACSQRSLQPYSHRTPPSSHFRSVQMPSPIAVPLPCLGTIPSSSFPTSRASKVPTNRPCMSSLATMLRPYHFAGCPLVVRIWTHNGLTVSAYSCLGTPCSCARRGAFSVRLGTSSLVASVLLVRCQVASHACRLLAYAEIHIFERRARVWLSCPPTRCFLLAEMHDSFVIAFRCHHWSRPKPSPRCN
jgi:hypothetical protein